MEIVSFPTAITTIRRCRLLLVPLTFACFVTLTFVVRLFLLIIHVYKHKQNYLVYGTMSSGYCC
jgi:hypothetical protein